MTSGRYWYMTNLESTKEITNGKTKQMDCRPTYWCVDIGSCTGLDGFFYRHGSPLFAVDEHLGADFRTLNLERAHLVGESLDRQADL